MLSSNTDKKIKFKFERGIFNSKFYSTYTFFQNLRKIRIYLSDSSLSYLEIFIKKFESHLNIQIYLHICDILNPITSHPQLLYPSCLVHQKSFNHLYESHEMFRTLCRVFNPFSIESFSRSIVAVNWRWIWMYVRFCRTWELRHQGGRGMNMRKRGWLVLIVGKQDFISLPQFRFSGISLRFCLQFEFGRGLEFFVTILRVCWTRTASSRITLGNEKKYF